MAQFFYGCFIAKSTCSFSKATFIETHALKKRFFLILGGRTEKIWMGFGKMYIVHLLQEIILD